MLIKQLSIGDLKPAEYNPRKDLQTGDPDYEKFKRSLTEFGYVEPVIWNKTTGRVVGGHQRLKVLEDIGHTSVDCVVVELDKTREQALNVALNKISGDWDQDKLALLIADLDASDFDVELTGFDDAEIQAMIGSLDDGDIEDDDFDLSAALEAASFVERGDIWAVGRHRLVCGDAINPDDAARLMRVAGTGVLRAHRGNRLGLAMKTEIMRELLIGEVAHQALQSGYETVGLRVDTLAAADAARLYQRLGFTQM